MTTTDSAALCTNELTQCHLDMSLFSNRRCTAGRTEGVIYRVGQRKIVLLCFYCINLDMCVCMSVLCVRVCACLCSCYFSLGLLHFRTFYGPSWSDLNKYIHTYIESTLAHVFVSRPYCRLRLVDNCSLGLFCRSDDCAIVC